MEKIKTLVSLSEMILQRYNDVMDSPYKDGVVTEQDAMLFVRYAQFLSQPLALWQFVPCDEECNFLEEPYKNSELDKPTLSLSVEAYNEAKQRCLFEGWKLRDRKKNLGFKIVVSDDFEINLDTLSCGQFIEGGYLDGRLIGNAIGQVADVFKGIKLTETALNQIY